MGCIGPEGQLVIEREILDHLGIQPGWEAVQEVDGDRLVVRFQPPMHSESLAGILKSYVRPDRAAPDSAEIERIVSIAVTQEREETLRGNVE